MPPCACSRSPFFRCRASVNAPRSCPKSSFSSRLSGQRRAGDVHERRGRAVALGVNGSRDEIFPGPALSSEEDGRRAVGDPVDEPLHDAHGLRCADEIPDAVRGALAREEASNLAGQAGRLERHLDEPEDLVEADHLRQVIECAALHRIDGAFESTLGPTER